MIFVIVFFLSDPTSPVEEVPTPALIVGNSLGEIAPLHGLYFRRVIAHIYIGRWTHLRP